MINIFLFKQENFYKLILKIFFSTIFIFFLSISFSEADKKKDDEEKDCLYCTKYEKLKDWPESERPEAFIYEEVNYPEGMFHKNNKTSKRRQGEAGKKVYQRFVKGKGQLNKYQH
jgi:hypothetical protein